MEIGFHVHIVTLLEKLYSKQQAKVRVAGVLSKGFCIKRGVRQGCTMSPYLFNILSETVMREALDGFEGGIRIGGRRISNLRYADDIVLLACTEAELQDLVNRLDQASRIYGLLINIEKTKVMVMGNNINSCITVQGNKLDQVDTFLYLGSLITAEGDCEKEIRARLAKGRSIGTSLRQIWRSHGITTSTKLRLLNALVWPVATYGCESWTIKKREEERINAFEMKCLRQVLRVSWTAKKTNEWVLKEAGVERHLLKAVKQRKLSYFGHVMRKTGDCLEKEMIQGTMPGTRRRGRPRTAWMDNIRKWTGLSMTQLMARTGDRDRWRATVHSVANPRIEDG